MFNFLNQIGMFGLPLLIIAIAILILSAKYSIQLWGDNQEITPDINKIVYLGILGLSLGLFSHFLGIYQASGLFAKMRPDQIAAGYGQSLLALLYGFGVFFIAASAWFLLRSKKRKLQKAERSERAPSI